MSVRDKNTLKNQGVAPRTNLRENRKYDQKSVGNVTGVRPKTLNLGEIMRQNPREGKSKEGERRKRPEHTDKPTGQAQKTPETSQKHSRVTG